MGKSRRTDAAGAEELQRAGLTGNVPYYGGRFTPAQAYAAAHPSAQPPAFPDPLIRGAAPPAQERL